MGRRFLRNSQTVDRSAERAAIRGQSHTGKSDQYDRSEYRNVLPKTEHGVDRWGQLRIECEIDYGYGPLYGPRRHQDIGEANPFRPLDVAGYVSNPVQLLQPERRKREFAQSRQ